MHAPTHLVLDRSRQQLQLAGAVPSGETGIGRDLADFMAAWQNASPTVTGHTSGSTGTPKRMELSKDAMTASAVMTVSFLGIPAGATAFLCMPLRFVGGKMMVVRSLVAQLPLLVVEPSAHPLKGLTTSPYFAAMTPQQVYCSLEDSHEAELLKGIHELIIGGGRVEADLARELAHFPHGVWSTYGMTETLSHIALKRLSAPVSRGYRAFEGVTLTTSPTGTLVIDAPALGVTGLKTNDIVTFLEDGLFTIEGRVDNTINSGGIKIQIETAESILREILPMPFQVSKAPDPKFGEKVVLLVTEPVSDELIARMRTALPRYWAPKAVCVTPTLPKTLSGKPDRAALAQLAEILTRPSAQS